MIVLITMKRDELYDSRKAYTKIRKCRTKNYLRKIKFITNNEDARPISINNTTIERVKENIGHQMYQRESESGVLKDSLQ